MPVGFQLGTFQGGASGDVTTAGNAPQLKRVMLGLTNSLLKSDDGFKMLWKQKVPKDKQFRGDFLEWYIHLARGSDVHFANAGHTTYADGAEPTGTRAQIIMRKVHTTAGVNWDLQLFGSPDDAMYRGSDMPSPMRQALVDAKDGVAEILSIVLWMPLGALGKLDADPGTGTSLTLMKASHADKGRGNGSVPFHQITGAKIRIFTGGANLTAVGAVRAGGEYQIKAVDLQAGTVEVDKAIDASVADLDYVCVSKGFTDAGGILQPDPIPFNIIDDGAQQAKLHNVTFSATTELYRWASVLQDKALANLNSKDLYNLLREIQMSAHVTDPKLVANSSIHEELADVFQSAPVYNADGKEMKSLVGFGKGMFHVPGFGSLSVVTPRHCPNDKLIVMTGNNSDRGDHQAVWIVRPKGWSGMLKPVKGPMKDIWYREGNSNTFRTDMEMFMVSGTDARWAHGMITGLGHDATI